MQPNHRARQHRIGALSGRTALGAVRRADADDGERNAVALGDPGAHRLPGDLGEAVVRPQRHPGRIGLGQRPPPLLGVDRAGGADDETRCGATVVQQFAGHLRVRLHAAIPVAGADIQRDRLDAGGDQLSRAAGSFRRAAPYTSFPAAARARAMGNAILPVAPVMRIFSAWSNRPPNVKYLIPRWSIAPAESKSRESRLRASARIFSMVAAVATE